jgi:hypothetical protein
MARNRCHDGCAASNKKNGPIAPRPSQRNGSGRGKVVRGRYIRRMSKKLPLTDFRASGTSLSRTSLRSARVPPSDLVEPEVWDGIMHLPEDVSIRISDHNGVRLKLLHGLWGDWVTAIGDPDKPDEIYNCMLDAADCFQCANFNFLHGYYRAAIAELRVALELVMIGAYGSLNPSDPSYLDWKQGAGEVGYTRCRRRLSGTLTKGQAKRVFEDGQFLAALYQMLCNYTHSRPDSNDGSPWESNGPVYHNAAIKLTFFTTLSVMAACYLLVRLARPGFVMPEDSDILFELDWMPHHAELVRAFTDLYGKAPKPPMT